MLLQKLDDYTRINDQTQTQKKIEDLYKHLIPHIFQQVT